MGDFQVTCYGCGSELVQKFIGKDSRMVRELFVMAREDAPGIVFMDEKTDSEKNMIIKKLSNIFPIKCVNVLS